MNWMYKIENEVTKIPEGMFGFIYCITYTDGTKYLGKKNFYAVSTLPAKKNGELREGATRIHKNKNGKRIPFDVITKESDWRKYCGSSKRTEDKEIEKKEILEFGTTKRHLTYLEVKHLFMQDVLLKEEFINDNILGKFYRGNLI